MNQLLILSQFTWFSSSDKGSGPSHTMFSFNFKQTGDGHSYQVALKLLKSHNFEGAGMCLEYADRSETW